MRAYILLIFFVIVFIYLTVTVIVFYFYLSFLSFSLISFYLSLFYSYLMGSFFSYCIQGVERCYQLGLFCPSFSCISIYLYLLFYQLFRIILSDNLQKYIYSLRIVSMDTGISIRVEKQSDYRITQQITRQAFWNLYKPGADQHALLHKMRKSKDFISELSLVILQGQHIIGHIMYSHSHVHYLNGVTLPTITFGPVSISPQKQSKGLGAELIKYSLKRACELGYKAVIILGYPSYYSRLGFKCSKQYNIKSSDGKYYAGMQVLELDKDYLLKQIEGVFKYSQSFNISEQEQREFDKSFAGKQKYVTISQKVFEKVSCAQWDNLQIGHINAKDSYNRQRIMENSDK